MAFQLGCKYPKRESRRGSVRKARTLEHPVRMVVRSRSAITRVSRAPPLVHLSGDHGFYHKAGGFELEEDYPTGETVRRRPEAPVPLQRDERRRCVQETDPPILCG